MNEWMNKLTSGYGDHILVHGTLLGNMEGAPLPGTLTKRLISRGWDVEGSCGWVSPYGSHWGA